MKTSANETSDVAQIVTESAFDMAENIVEVWDRENKSTACRCQCLAVGCLIDNKNSKN